MAVASPAEARRRDGFARWLAGVPVRIAAMVRRVADEVAQAADDALAITGSSVKLPQWLTAYLIAQLVASIWWAATLQSDVRYLQTRNTELWQKLEAVQLLQASYDKNLARYDSGLDERVRRSVRETLDDLDYLRVHPRGQREDH